MTQPRLIFCNSGNSGMTRAQRARSSTVSRKGDRSAFLALAVSALVAAACDGAVPSVDASMPVSAHSAQTSAVSLRIDVVAGQPASLSVLAFRAAFSGVAPGDVLGMVDPLAADAPHRDCQLRDVDLAAAALVARGDAIELEELSGIGISVAPDGASTAEIRPSPRLYPDLAATIGGVVGEAGPLRLPALPAEIRVRGGMTTPVSPDQVATAADAATVGVPATGWVRLLNGAVPRDGILIPAGSDLNLNLTPPDTTDTSVELRPFGGTVALSCAVTAANSFTIPRQALNALIVASGGAPGASVAAALDLVRRSGKTLPLSSTRVSLEVRTSTFVELRP
ncbi:MAG: hypothetical protein ABJA82_07395 [Myxococcales bacterium]